MTTRFHISPYLNKSSDLNVPTAGDFAADEDSALFPALQRSVTAAAHFVDDVYIV